ncbi:MAG: hypothetical protein WA825_03115 [Steroidobacteraceae bacterium]
MNAKVSANGRTKAGEVLKVVGLAAALLVGSSAVFAEPHGGGFGGGSHFSGGGGAHFSGGGGAHFSGGGGAHFSAGGHVGAPQMNVNRGSVGGHYSAAQHYYAPAGGHIAGRVGGAYTYGHGYGYRGGYGYRPAWGGGYWHGGFWPAAYYGWSYPLYLGFLPAVYATYWWGGIPYYYVDNVYYTWNAADNGYVAADPPPAADGYSDDVNAADAAGPAAGNAAADNAPPDVAQGAQSNLGIIAYPRNGQSEQQQSTDKFQCHTWAKGQAGFDPSSQSSSNASAAARSAYGRAMSACLEARGYTVR